MNKMQTYLMQQKSHKNTIEQTTYMDQKIKTPIKVWTLYETILNRKYKC